MITLKLVHLLIALIHIIQVKPDQIPFQNPFSTQHQYEIEANEEGFAPLVFNSLNGLLKSWDQAFQPNARAIYPGIIPQGTLLYNLGPFQPSINGTGPEWFA
jgi:hypothetical protein